MTPPKKVLRNLGDDESRAFWAAVKADALAVGKLPEWKRAGVSSNNSEAAEDEERP